jgi:hypothetical protein
MLSVAIVALLAGCGGSQPPIGAPGTILGARPNTTESKTFKFTGAAQSFVVPANVTTITVTAYGASGASQNNYKGGNGGEIKAALPVSAGETLYVVVGGEGAVDSGYSNGLGGFNGGGNGGLPNDFYLSGGYGGGGASDVREGNSGTGARVLVAGGGGGPGIWGNSVVGGMGGGRIGGPGGGGGGNNGRGGGGGGWNKGGKGGAGGKFFGFKRGERGQDGIFVLGGDGGGGSYNASAGGGGGGGGWYGGGGGGSGSGYTSGGGASGGGGGGSSHAESKAKVLENKQGAAPAGNGEIIISWQSQK